MWENCDNYTLNVRDTFNQMKNIINGLILASIVGSISYFFFWLGAISDPYILDSGKNFFYPLASFFNPNSNGAEIYLSTSFMLLFATFPALIVYYFLDKQKDALISAKSKKEAAKKAKEELEAKKAYATRYDYIHRYAICLSIDYESTNKILKENKIKLNNAIFSKIKNSLNEIDKEAYCSASDVLVYSSDDFSKYDYVHSLILKTLSEIKPIIEKNYALNLIPSITTDAYSEKTTLNTIRNQHFEIQSFNFKNRALSTATFTNKYKHLNHKKYAGIPIGEYAYFKNNKTDTYELNVVHKNLTKMLSQIN